MATIPAPSTTRTQSTTSTQATRTTSPATCNSINIPDYNTLRQDNLYKITTYYSELLGSYTQSYKDYSTQIASSNVNDRLYAKNTLKPKVDNYNQQIINLSEKMINNVNQDTDLIMEQKNELTTKTRQIDNLIENITLLKDKDNEMSVLTGARKDSLYSAQNSKEDMTFYTWVYIGICVLLVFIVIGIIIYIVFNNYTNTGTSNNNIHKNIITNQK